MLYQLNKRREWVSCDRLAYWRSRSKGRDLRSHTFPFPLSIFSSPLWDEGSTPWAYNPNLDTHNLAEVSLYVLNQEAHTLLTQYINTFYQLKSIREY